jgi:hypothetical protein
LPEVVCVGNEDGLPGHAEHFADGQLQLLDVMQNAKRAHHIESPVSAIQIRGITVHKVVARHTLGMDHSPQAGDRLHPVKAQV